MDVKNSIDVLVLGETGVGKTTLINAIINSQYCKTMEEAIDHGNRIVPSTFVLHDDDYNRIDVVSKPTLQLTPELMANESQINGETFTQQPVTYEFRFSNNNFRFIDTPGLVDTRGDEQDQINKKNVEEYISHPDFAHLTAVLMVFRPNTSDKLTAVLQILINYLQRLALESPPLIFAFVNSRADMYKPGPILDLIRQELGGSAEFSPNTIFCVENESFRYICAAAEKKMKLTADELRSFGESYIQSAKESKRLLNQLIEISRRSQTDNIQAAQVKTEAAIQTKQKIKYCNEIMKYLKQEMMKNVNMIAETEEHIRMLHNKEEKIVCTSRNCQKRVAHHNSNQNAHEVVCFSTQRSFLGIAYLACWCLSFFQPFTLEIIMPLWTRLADYLSTCTKGIFKHFFGRCTNCSDRSCSHKFMPYQPRDFGFNHLNNVYRGPTMYNSLIQELEEKKRKNISENEHLLPMYVQLSLCANVQNSLRLGTGSENSAIKATLISELDKSRAITRNDLQLKYSQPLTNSMTQDVEFIIQKFSRKIPNQVMNQIKQEENKGNVEAGRIALKPPPRIVQIKDKSQMMHTTV